MRVDISVTADTKTLLDTIIADEFEQDQSNDRPERSKSAILFYGMVQTVKVMAAAAVAATLVFCMNIAQMVWVWERPGYLGFLMI